MPLGLLGKKLGMSQIFDESGMLIPVTLLQVGPCPVLMKRVGDRDGYSALQLGFDPKPDRLVKKPEAGLFEKVKEKMKPEDRDRVLAAGLGVGENGEEAQKSLDEARKRYSMCGLRFIREVRLDDASAYEIGQVIDVSVFKPGDRVDVVGTSKGRGYMGPVKRHHSKPGPASHGSMYHRRPGAMSGSSDPSRVYKLKPSAGHMGAGRVTALNLQGVRADPGRTLLVVRGSVPGAPNGYVVIRPTVKVRRRPAKTYLA